MITRSTVLVLAASVLIANGCGTAYPKAEPAAPVAAVPGPGAEAEEAAAVAAAMRQASATRVDYKISAADLVSINVYNNPEMSRKVRVNASGFIFLPLVGAVKVGGKSLSAAQSLIEEKLSAYVIRPQATLFIEDYGNKNIFVMGEVQKPGSYPIPTESRITVMEAISTAGGFTPVAAQDRARVLRYVDGKSLSYTVDVRNITREGQKEKDMALEPNDVVYVPQSMF